MIKKLVISIIIPLAVAFGVAYFIYKALIGTDVVKQDIKLEIVLDSFQESNFQFFLEDSVDFKAENSQTVKLYPDLKNQKIEFDILEMDKPGKIRLDPSITSGIWQIKKIKLKGLSNDIEFTADSIVKHFVPNADVKTFELTKEKTIKLESSGNDAYIVSDFYLKDYLEILEEKPIINFLPFCFSLCCFFLLFYLLQQKMQTFSDVTFTTNHILLVSFIIIIGLPFIWMNLFPIEQNIFTEKRVLKPKPAFDFIHINRFFNNYANYFEDNLGFKKELSTINSYYKFKIFRTSSKPDRVIVGKDSWLYSTEPEIAGDYQNLESFSEDNLNTIKQNLEEMVNAYQQHHIKFYTIILPTKSSIYPEHLPNFIDRLNKPTKLAQLSSYLKQFQSVNFIDITNDFINEKKSNDVFYQHDVHMNYRGGFVAYQKLITELQKSDSRIYPMKLGYYFKKLVHIPNADLSNILSLDYKLLNDEWYLEKGGSKSYKKIEPSKYETIPIQQKTVKTKNHDSKLPKAVIYRDSFFNLMMPYFSENFRECIYIWSYEMSDEIIQKEKPDFVILEMTEATINRLLNDNPKWIKDACNK